MPLIRKIPNPTPIFFANILVDLDGRRGAIHPITALTFAPGNPVLFAGRLIHVIGLESTANDAPKDQVAVKDSPARPIECHAANATGTRDRASLPLDIHDPCFHPRAKAICRLLMGHFRFLL